MESITFGGIMMLFGTPIPTLADLEINVILGGFGLFLLGINFLGDGLKDAAGPKIRDYIEKYTGSLLSSIIVGTVITALLQSSTAATIISISLVRAGLMKLDQAIGISVGANLGTTVTAIMIGFNIEELGYYFAFLGAVMLIVAKRKQFKSIALVVFGFGITFVGLQLMGDRLTLLQYFPQFESFMVSMSTNPWLALLAGTGATAVINSSSAVIALVQKIYAGGGMDMVAASAFIFGSNVGTTLTAILASSGGSISTRRAGWFHALYNIIGALLVMFIIVPYSNLITYLNTVVNGSPEMAIGINHFVFNFIFVVLIIPFIPAFIKLLKILIPGEDRIKTREKLEPLDYDLVETFPEGALTLAKNNTIKMADLVKESLQTSLEYLKSKDQEEFDVVMQLEEMVNQLDFELTHYLIAIQKQKNASFDTTDDFTANLEIIKNLERISDLTTNIVEFYQMMFEERENFTEDAIEDVENMYQLLFNMMDRAFRMYETDDTSELETLIREEDYLDQIEVKYRERHFQRMAEGRCDAKVGSSIYVDILGILERIGDHSINVASYTHEGLAPDVQFGKTFEKTAIK